MVKKAVIPIERIVDKIYLIRSQKVMLDRDLAELYGTETKVLLQAVKRNLERFPEEFMFQLNDDEFVRLRSQIVTSNRGGRRYLPYVFTEHGALMLASVLRSKKSIEISIIIVKTFVRLREMLAAHEDVVNKLAEHDKQIANLYAHVERLLSPKSSQKNSIGYIWDKK